MTATPLHWETAALRQALAPLLPSLEVEAVATIDSTNTRLLARARTGADAPCLLIAEEQTAGRGRLGRDWRSRSGASLTFSLSLPLAPADWSGLSLAVGVALADALDPWQRESPLRIGLKWPNDLWLLDAPATGRKLGGVLIETVEAGSARIAVVGCGINVLPAPDLAPGLSQGYASLQEIDGQAAAPQALAGIAGPLIHALQRFEAEGFAPFGPAYRRRDVLRGQPVTTSDPALPTGIAEGVDDQGALLLRAAGQLHRIVSGEVGIRLQPGAARC